MQTYAIDEPAFPVDYASLASSKAGVVAVPTASVGEYTALLASCQCAAHARVMLVPSQRPWACVCVKPVAALQLVVLSGKWGPRPNPPSLPAAMLWHPPRLPPTRLDRPPPLLQFTGSLIINVTGTYRFWLGSDDGSRLWINDQMVVGNGGMVSCCWKLPWQPERGCSISVPEDRCRRSRGHQARLCTPSMQAGQS